MNRANSGWQTTAGFNFIDCQQSTGAGPYYGGKLSPTDHNVPPHPGYRYVSGIPIRDVRGSEQQYSLHKHGFTFTAHSACAVNPASRSEDIDAYLCSVAETIKDQQSAQWVFCYDYKFRSNDSDIRRDDVSGTRTASTSIRRRGKCTSMLRIRVAYAESEDTLLRQRRNSILTAKSLGGFRSSIAGSRSMRLSRTDWRFVPGLLRNVKTTLPSKYTQQSTMRGSSSIFAIVMSKNGIGSVAKRRRR